MGSKSNVQTYTQRAKFASTIEDKLDALANAIYEVADFIEDLENKLNSLERKMR